MARAATTLIHNAASACGGLVAFYSRSLVCDSTTRVLFATPLGSRPVVWIGWHEGNLLTLAVHQRIVRRVGIAFVPPGFSGEAMRGWLDGLGISPVAISQDARRGLGLRRMEAAIGDGKDVLIAVDGPHGPRHSIARGALWLARATGAEVRPVGSASSLSLRLPRWDRLIVPLPGARNIVAVGAPWSFAELDRRSSWGCTRLADELHGLSRYARAALSAENVLRPMEVAPWK
jgi:lysophospholipid acyltransferase (LPLAT)-like uncharacterized protein